MKKVATLQAVGPADRKPAQPQAPAGQPRPLPAEHLLALHQHLQGTLSVGTLINRFFLWLGEQLPVASIEYIYPDEKIRFANGDFRQHTAHYVLRLEQRYLGEITLTAKNRLPEQHLFVQEQAMSVLVHYIKNALDHLVLEKVAYRDSLTGVMNRTALDELLPKEVDRAQRYDYELSVAMIDLDHFKAINDQVGHPGADQVLREVSTAILAQLRSSDLTFRYGGDEFMVILPGTSLTGARKAAGLIADAVAAQGVETAGQKIIPQLSTGVVARRLGESAEELMLRVDSALYEAKKAGRNCIR